MRPITSFQQWTRVDENTKVAKQYVISTIPKRKKSREGEPELSAEELEREALSSPEVQKIFDLTKSTPGNTLAFLRFHFEQKVPISQPENIEEVRSLEKLMKIIKEKKHLISQLEHNLDYYASQPVERGMATPFERMADEIRTMERAKEAKWFIDSLPRQMRDTYRTLPKSSQAETINLAVQLAALGKPIIKRLFDKIKAMSRWTLDDVIDYTKNYVRGYADADMKKKVDAIMELEPEAGLLYLDDRYLVITVRTEKAQKDLCSIANWCINRGSWNTYSNTGVQINIFDFGLDPSEPMYLTGTTVRYDGTLNTSHDINDKFITQDKDPEKHFLKLGYPEKLVSSIMDQFPIESVIKKLVGSFSINDSKIEQVLFNVIRSSYVIPTGTNSEALEALSDILITRVREKMSRGEVLEQYNKWGVLSKFSAMLFNRLLSDATETEREQVIKSTLGLFLKIENLAKKGAASTPQIKNVLAQKDETLRELGYSSMSEALNHLTQLQRFNSRLI